MELTQTFLLVGSITFGAPHLACGQTIGSPEPVKSARFYVGLGGFFGRYRIPYVTHTYDEAILAPTPTAGYQLTARLGIQISWARYKASFHHEGQAYNRVTGQDIGTLYEDDSHTIMSLPILLRYATARRQEHRIQFDVLAGITFLRATHRHSEKVVDTKNSIFS